ncbi:MAG: polyprenyl synthetase family protein [Calditrichia bacterium]
MNIFEKLQPLIESVQRTLQENVRESFPHTLKEPIKYFLETPGKKVRPLLTLLSCQAVGGAVEPALPAAAGVELFHDFTLIHDDIMDRDDLRRGRPTIHKIWDEGAAILAGDALVGMAYASILQCDREHLPEVLNHFSEGIIKVCEGQALDKEFESRQQVSTEEYLDMISKKTAWLFKLACQIGAILGGGSPDQVEHLRRFGDNLGLGFQMQDDLLDFVAEEEKLGKKVGSDLKMDKKTYVTLKYEEHLRQNPELASRYPAKILQFASLEDLKNALFDLGIVEETRREVDACLEEALQNLEAVQPLNENNDIYQIVQFLRTRQY